MRATGVEYTTVPDFDGELFRCEAYRATLSIGACAKRWNGAKRGKPEKLEQLEKCRGCSLGAVHAGSATGYDGYYHPFYGAAMCARCRRGSFRIIGSRLCPSCFNRSR